MRREAGWVFANATHNADKDQIEKMIKQGIMICLSTLVKESDVPLIKIGLEGLENMIRMGKVIAEQEGTENKILIELENNGIVQVIEKLQEHENNDVYEKALKIVEDNYELESYF